MTTLKRQFTVRGDIVRSRLYKYGKINWRFFVSMCKWSGSLEDRNMDKRTTLSNSLVRRRYWLLEGMPQAAFWSIQWMNKVCSRWCSTSSYSICNSINDRLLYILGFSLFLVLHFKARSRLFWFVSVTTFGRTWCFTRRVQSQHGSKPIHALCYIVTSHIAIARVGVPADLDTTGPTLRNCRDSLLDSHPLQRPARVQFRWNRNHSAIH